MSASTVNSTGQSPTRVRLFKIYSLTGLSIQEYSTFQDEEEVTFLPFTEFTVGNPMKDEFLKVPKMDKMFQSELHRKDFEVIKVNAIELFQKDTAVDPLRF